MVKVQKRIFIPLNTPIDILIMIGEKYGIRKTTALPHFYVVPKTDEDAVYLTLLLGKTND